MKSKLFTGNLLLFVSSLFVGLILLEILLRLLPQNISKIDYSIVGDERIYSASKYVEFKPNYTRVWTNLGPPTVWHFNNLGFRERNVKITKEENLFRIVVIGDSIVIGFGVEDFEAFPRRLELELKPKVFDPAMKHFEVLNLGIQGYSTPQYLAVLEEDAVPLKPDLALITIYPSNDVGGAVSFTRDQKYINLMAIPDIIPFRVNQFLKKYSRLYLFLLTKYYTFISKYESDYKTTSADDNEGWDLIKGDLIKTKETADKNNIKLVLLNIPNPRDVSESRYSDSQKKINSLSKELGIIYFDLFEDLKKYKNVRELYMDDLDDHFSVKGNQYLASLLSKFLIENELVPRQPQN